MLVIMKERMKEPSPCLPVKYISNQNHGQVRVCSQGKPKEKQVILGQLPRIGSRWESETFALGLVVQCLLGASYNAERRLFLGDCGYLCVCSCRISFYFKRSAASCFSKRVNTEISLESPFLDLAYPMACSGSAGFAHCLGLMFTWLGETGKRPR